MKLKRLLKILFPACLAALAVWSGVRLYEVAVGYREEAQAILDLEFKVEEAFLEEDNLTLRVKLVNPSGKPVYLSRLGVTILYRGLPVGNLYKEFKPRFLEVKPHSNQTEIFKIVIKGLSFELKGFRAKIYALASTRYVRDIPLAEEEEISF